MNKVLLVYDDYTELMSAQFTLKKVGFDVMAVSSEFSIKEQIVSFNPDIVVGYGKGNKVSTVGVGKRLKEMPRWQGKSILIFAPGVKPLPEELIKIRMDTALEAPVEMVRLIQVLAKFSNQDDQILMEKLIKSTALESQKNESTLVTGGKESKEEWRVSDSGGKDPSLRVKGHAPKANTFPVNLNDEQGGGGEPGESETSSETPKLKNPLKDSFNDTADAESSNAKVDWSEMERQLLGKEPKANPSQNPNSGSANDLSSLFSPPTEESAVEGRAPPSSSIPVSEGEESGKHVDELAKAQAQLSEKVSRYNKFLSGIDATPYISALSRKALRQIQKDLSKSWSPSELKQQDQLRREFTKALFEGIPKKRK